MSLVEIDLHINLMIFKAYLRDNSLNILPPPLYNVQTGKCL